jgi:flagella basal body P-ring formation protein FlgA
VIIQPVRADALDQNAITTPAHLIGKAARRGLVNGRPLNGADVRDPQMVSRGGIVIMTYRTDNLSITAHGKAREHGTTGDVVRVQNLNSGKMVETIVTGPDTVTVRALSQATVRCAKCR